MPLQRKTQCLRQNPVAKAAKAVNRQTIAKSVAFCSFVPLQRKTQCLRQNLIAKAAKAVMSTEQSEWRHLEAVAKVRGILLPKDFHAKEYKTRSQRRQKQSCRPSESGNIILNTCYNDKRRQDGNKKTKIHQGI